METAGVEPAPPRCKRGALPLELHPLVGRTECGRMESNHHSARHRVYSAGSSPDAQRPRGARWPTGFEPAPTGLTTPGASDYTTATTKRGRPDSNRRPLA
jgi:hypothetical protein